MEESQPHTKHPNRQECVSHTNLPDHDPPQPTTPPRPPVCSCGDRDDNHCLELVPPSCAPEHLHPEYAQHLNILHDNFRRDLSLATTLLDDWIAKGQLHRRDFRPREGEGILDSDLSPVTTTALLKRQRGQKDGGHKMDRGKSCENGEQRSDEASRRHMKFPRLHVESVQSSQPKMMNKQAIAHPAEKHFDRLGLEQERPFRDGVSDWISSLNYAELIA